MEKGYIDMTAYQRMNREELLQLKEELEAQYKEAQAKNLSLDMSRGKPAKEQLDLSISMLGLVQSESDVRTAEGLDCRNYGVVDGIMEAKELMGTICDAPADQVIVYGNSSLNVMYDSISRAMTHGVLGSVPWSKLENVKFLCPVPGYDRHFSITEYFGIEMVLIPMTPEGPDMNEVERWVNNDASVKGIWCSPKYSNPQGIVYSDETVRRFARLQPAADDFRIYWDHAYAVHDLYPEEPEYCLNLLDECEKAGNPDLAYVFASTSKITFPGAGVAAFASSKRNIAEVRNQLMHQSIGHDKLNQLRHVKFFKEVEDLTVHMKKHADLLRPKFDLVLDVLHKELDGLEIGQWVSPQGGYFISFDSMPGCAKAIVQKAKDAGVIMTNAGATYPYGLDPNDSNIRIAPSFPTLSELAKAMQIFTLCVKLVSVEKILEQ